MGGWLISGEPAMWSVSGPMPAPLGTGIERAAMASGPLTSLATYMPSGCADGGVGGGTGRPALASYHHPYAEGASAQPDGADTMSPAAATTAPTARTASSRRGERGLTPVSPRRWWPP